MRQESELKTKIFYSNADLVDITYFMFTHYTDKYVNLNLHKIYLIIRL
jgi:hypothetical protein